MAEQLAVMKGVSYGLRDVGRPCLSFSTYISDSGSASQVLFGEDADRVIKDAGAVDIRNLEGRACWVEVGGGIIKFLRVAKI